MDVQEKLKRYFGQLIEKRYIVQLETERYSELVEGAKPRGIDYSKTRVQKSVEDNLCNNTIRLADQKERVHRAQSEFYGLEDQIVDQIRGLHNPIYNQILYKVYVQGKSLKVTQKEMDVSYSFVRDKHKEALQAFADKYPEVLT